MKDVKLDELKDEEMYCLVAPDGSAQLMSLAPEFAMCIGFTELLASAGISEPVAKLFEQGYSILPVKVTIIQNGDAESGFQKAKKKMK